MHKSGGNGARGGRLTLQERYRIAQRHRRTAKQSRAEAQRQFALYMQLHKPR